jgi:PTH1 family peptidyl-tRNA hydrolase
MPLLAGLGNPGDRYARTRHNVGFLALDGFQLTQAPSAPWKKDGKCLVSRCGLAGKTLEGTALHLAKPQSFMNLSGEALLPLLTFFKIPPAELVVVTDDVTLPLGSVRIRPKGGHGGHNGLRNIIAQIGENFPRIRIGVGPVPPGWDMAEFLLSPIQANDLSALMTPMEKISEMVMTGLIQGWDLAATRFNRVA